MMLNNNQQTFFALVRAGLWEQNFQLSQPDRISYQEIYRLSEAQSVVGLVAAGLEQLIDIKVPKEVIMQFVGNTLQIEQRNKTMNSFLAVLIGNLKTEGISCALVKGQGVAQCYERPLWRSSGDIDLLFDKDNYHKASDYLSTKADEVKENRMDIMHFEMSFSSWVVELHGTLHGEWSTKVDYVIDKIQTDTFKNNDFRSWNNNGVEVSLPSPDSEVLFVFSHILQHFFWGGIGLRQICDWSRLLWTYKDSIDRSLLKERLEEMDLMSEWNAFGALAVKWLGMPVEAMPFYDSASKHSRKANRIISLVLETGNFGHSRNKSYKEKYPFLIRLCISFWQHVKDNIRLMMIFPLDSIKVWWRMMMAGAKAASNMHLMKKKVGE